MLKTEIKETLKDYAKGNDIRAEVAREALERWDDYDGDIEGWFNDLLSHGCSSGMVGSMIYYCDTHNFYDKYYDEIEDLRYEYEESFGCPLQPEGDLKNWFAWFAFEETARRLADELELNI